MPLHTKKRSEADVRSLPDDLSSNEEVFVVRFTGEVFRDYEEYLRAISQYRQRVWTCRLTGKDNLSFEEALASEQGGKDFSGKFPKVCEEAASHLVHWALARMDELLTRVTNFFRDYFVAGEEVLGRSGDAFAMCRIMSRAQIQASPDNTYYEVAWLDGPQKGGFATLPRNFLARRKPPFSRGTLKAWLMENASSREVGRPGGAKGPLSLWQVRQNMAQRFQLPSDPPPHVVQQVRRIESNSAEGGLSASSTSDRRRCRGRGLTAPSSCSTTRESPATTTTTSGNRGRPSLTWRRSLASGCATPPQYRMSSWMLSCTRSLSGCCRLTKTGTTPSRRRLSPCTRRRQGCSQGA
uniref:Bromodomain adjacent to zinc finger domain protein 1A n=1 Tax=Tetraselmis sp. GSL018 TaxID=582737 RepID=A0A061RY44_9CHLO